MQNFFRNQQKMLFFRQAINQQQISEYFDECAHNEFIEEQIKLFCSKNEKYKINITEYDSVFNNLYDIYQIRKIYKISDDELSQLIQNMEEINNITNSTSLQNFEKQAKINSMEENIIEYFPIGLDDFKLLQQKVYNFFNCITIVNCQLIFTSEMVEDDILDDSFFAKEKDDKFEEFNYEENFNIKPNIQVIQEEKVLQRANIDAESLNQSKAIPENIFKKAFNTFK